MARGRTVKLDVRLKPSAAADLDALKARVAAGDLTEAEALDLARQVALNTAEYRIDGGPWRRLGDA